MRVVGIDPAPGKASTVFDGRRFCQLSSESLRSFLAELADEPDVLVAWDAPLTGPQDPGGAIVERDFTQRPIETFFRRAEYGFKVPKGISVLGYGGCPHWTISRALVGLPRLGRFDAALEELPFRLVTEDVPPASGRWIVEVHPAVAIWLVADSARPGRGWAYKRDAAVFADVVDVLLGMGSVGELLATARTAEGWADTDDHLDAWVAWALARLWVSEGGGGVGLLADARTGGMLMPWGGRVAEAWGRFRHGARG